MVRIFPSRRPILVVNEGCKIPKKIRIADIDLEVVSQEWFLNYKDFQNGDFRQGFWQLTINRLYVLGEIHEKIFSPLIHIESDVLIMTDFPWEAFDSMEKLSWMKVSTDHDIAAILHMPSGYLTKRLIAEIKKTIKECPEKTDMTALSEVSKRLPNDFQYLPSCPTQWSRFEVLRNAGDKTELGNPPFGGYFDPAALGIWHLGQDPRNHFGRSRIHVDPSTHDIDPSKVTLNINEKGGVSDQFGNRVFNLHVHSKNNKLFKDKSTEYLNKLLLSSLRSKPKSRFFIKKFLLSFTDYPFPKNFWVLVNATDFSKNTYTKKVLKSLKWIYNKTSN